MSDVSKYIHLGSRMMETTKGEWVKASDYDALSARCEDLERRLAGAWVVRELEWRECNAWHWRAEGPFVVIDLYLTIDGGYWWSGGCGCSSTKEFPSLDAAKAAAQAWFNEKMTAGLRRAGG